MTNKLIIRQLEYFSYVYRERSYTRAAKLIPLSLQGLIKSINLLEQDLGVVLFSSNNSNVLEPTPFADELYALVSKWIADVHELESRFAQLTLETRRQIDFGIATGMMGFVGIDAEIAFQRSQAGLSLNFVELSDYEVDNALLSRDFNIALTSAPYHKDFVTQEVFSSNFCIWVHKDNPLAQEGGFKISDLNNQALGIMGPLAKAHGVVLDFLEQHAISPKSLVHAGNLLLLYEYALQQKGLSFGLMKVKNLYHESDKVVSIPIKGLCWRFGISHASSHKLTEDEETVVGYLIDRLKESGDIPRKEKP